MKESKYLSTVAIHKYLLGPNLKSFSFKSTLSFFNLFTGKQKEIVEELQNQLNKYEELQEIKQKETGNERLSWSESDRRTTKNVQQTPMHIYLFVFV